MDKISFNEKHPTVIPASIAGFMLLGAIPEDLWPYAYYTILRFIVCGTSIFIAYKAYDIYKKLHWVILYSLISILFNPLIPIHLEKETWIIIDLIVALLIFLSIIIVKSDNEKAAKTK